MTQREPISPGGPDAVFLQTLLRQAIAAHQGGDLAAAADPQNADALHLSGLIEFQLGRAERAVDLIGRAIAENGGVADYHANLGRVLQAQGRPKQAAESYRHAVRLAPGEASIHSDLASALIAGDDFPGARAAAEEAIRLGPERPEAHLNLGLAHLYSGDAPAALAALDRALALRPDYALALFHKGAALQETDAPRAAVCYRRALEIEPGMAEARCNLGNVLKDQGDFAGATACYRETIAARPDLAEAHANLGVALHELGDLEGAQAALDRAVGLAPDSAEFHRNRAMVLLLRGRFAEGWQEYEWRWRTRHFAPLRRSWPMPKWTGEPLPGKRILIHAEQGFGDTLQFMRFLPAVAGLGADIVFECPAELAALAGPLVGKGRVIAAGNPLPPADYHCPLLSLPGILKVDLASIPADVPYIEPDAERLAAWAERVPPSSRPRVGVAWRGSAAFKRDKVRSPGFAAIRPLFDLDGVDLFALQMDGGSADLKAAGLEGAVPDITDGWRDFSDTAAAVAQFDLVIAPDTALAHLAGALGKPVWVLLPHVAEWRWLTGRTDSPWYPTARLFRQEARGDWAGVVGRIVAALKGL